MPMRYNVGMTQQILEPTQTAAAFGDKCLAIQLWTDLVECGFAVVETNGTTSTSFEGATKVILKPTLSVDPTILPDVNGESQEEWRIFFEVKGSGEVYDPAANGGLGDYVLKSNRGLYFRVGTKQQLINLTEMDTTLDEYPFIPPKFEFLSTEQRNQLGISSGDQSRLSVEIPMSYRVTVAPRGFVIAAWPSQIVNDMRHCGIICVQRGVGCSGAMTETGKKPLFMVTNVSATGSGLSLSNDFPSPRPVWFYQVVREADTVIAVPDWTSITAGNGAPGGINGYRYNSNYISDERELGGQSLNYFPTRWPMPVLTDTNEYIMVFPFGLCTKRFAYADEIDLLAVSKAEAYQSGQTVPLNVFGEDRDYTAIITNTENEPTQGIMAFMLTNGGGV